MKKITLHISNWPQVAFIIALLLLIYDPVIWLANTWFDPSYDSSGFFLFLICLAFFIWSITSPKINHAKTNRKIPLLLLTASAITRLIGQLFAINVIGALTLVIDIYALAKLCGLDVRSRAISPFWLAVSFAFSLPLERVVQRLFGYGLQNFSADGACMVLSGVFDNVVCQGVRILINTQDVLVDLPCSGARAFLLLLFFFSISSMLSRLKFLPAFLGLLATVVIAYLINVLRICILATGLGYPNLLGGIDVMSQPAHDIIGLLMLCLGAVPIILWARRHYQEPSEVKSLPKKIKNDAWWFETKPSSKLNWTHASLFFLFALIVVNLPRQAFDVEIRDLPLELPIVLNNRFASPVELHMKEQAYFTQYGGAAKKATYGDHSLLVVKTSAPLRHLHAPDDCLRGLGMDVQYVGLQYSPIPTAIYKATDVDDNIYRVSITFISSKNNYMTTNVSEAVWRWTQDTSQIWTAIQRISRWDDFENAQQFDRAVIASFELPQTSIQFTQLMEK